MHPPKITSRLFGPTSVLIFTIGFSVAYFIFAHEGFYWLDDYIYTKYAWQLQQDIFDLNKPILPPNPLTNRIMIFAPAALFYSFFGLNIYAATLWPLLCGLGCSALIFFLYHRSRPIVATAGILLLGLYYHTLFLSTYFYPDNILMFFAFASAAVLYHFRFVANGEKPKFYASLFVVCNFLAFLSKETIIYYLPFYLILFFTDFFSKKHSVFWFYSIVFGVLVLSAYFIFYYFETGDFFHRFHVIEQTNAAYHEGETEKPFSHILWRLTEGPLLFFIGAGIFVPFAFALGLAFKTKIGDIFKARTEEGFWLLLALLVMAQFWFGSTSLNYYNPITLLPRMCMQIMPPLCLAGAFGVHYFLNGNRKLAGVFTLLFAAAALNERGNMLAMYVPMALFFGWQWWQMRKPAHKLSVALFVLALMAVLCLRPLHFMQKTSFMAFQEQNEIIKTHLQTTTKKTLVITDPWLKFMHDFHYDFQPNPAIRYQAFKDTIPDLQDFKQVFLLVNQASLSNPDMAKMQVVQKPQIDSLFPDKTLVTKNGPVHLYLLRK